MPLLVFDCKRTLPHAASGLKLLSRPKAGTSKSNRRDGLLPIHFEAVYGWSSQGHNLIERPRAERYLVISAFQ
jgi:hypothetical protein